ncbi:hypothetical protein KQI38_04720 [Tissierella carlieri]|uniref:histidine kinase n=1 Tax=Tissierella carlieri TaxID=689904 RepID=A0ABT1SDW9_9FIRM|nr:ATP-binding protein [Tissierella carlieri]MBU5311320.1 hypothetical protein [Tissierella carlieri]MCQ4924614.1 histidine kinase [Tissierella carlieri]
MARDYFLLYLIYGFAFINMGIFSIQGKDAEVTDLPLVKSLKYLGYFGISHGITEWITMIEILDIYSNLYIFLFVIKYFLKAVSFAYLMIFGISLLPLKHRYRKIILKVPIILFLVWMTGFILLSVYYGQDYLILNPKYNIIVLRYIMALSGGIVSAIALYLNGKTIEKRKSNSMAKRYKGLACIFLIYGLLDGLIVKKMNFFPANIINDNLFLEIFQFPIQIFKASVGITINFLLIKVIDTFGWEQKEKINRLEERRIASEERRKLGLEIHDSIIQSLYAAGLKVEYLIKNKSEDNIEPMLKEIKIDLNNTIDKTREFLSSSTLEIIEMEDLNYNLQQLVRKFNENQDIPIEFKSNTSQTNYGHLSPEKSTQIYYIVQEAISNVIKHSKATYAEVLLESKYDFLYIKVIDNGLGISMKGMNFEKHFGISSMEERAKRIGGILNIDKIGNGTKVEIMIPWGDTRHEGQDKSLISR